MAEKENIQRAAELLLNGASMLGISCPNCSSPIYLLKDKTMFCVNCNSTVVHENSIVPQGHAKKQQSEKVDVIRAKINQLSAQLEAANDPDEIISLANTIKKLQQLSN